MVPISSLHYFLITETSLAQSEFLFSVSLRVAPRNWERQVQIRSIPQHVGWAIRKIITKNSEFLGYLLHGYFTGKLAISRVNLPLHANFTGTSRGVFFWVHHNFPKMFSTWWFLPEYPLDSWPTPVRPSSVWNPHSWVVGGVEKHHFPPKFAETITAIPTQSQILNQIVFFSGFFSQVCWRSQPWISKFSWFLPRWWWSCNSINILPSTVAWTWWETDATPSGWPSSMRRDGGPQGVSCWAGWLWMDGP